jgi:hypothetical protein
MLSQISNFCVASTRLCRFHACTATTWDTLLPGRSSGSGGGSGRLGRGRGGGGGSGTAPVGLPKYPRPMLEPNYLPTRPWSEEGGGGGGDNEGGGYAKQGLAARMGKQSDEETAAVRQRNKTCVYAGKGLRWHYHFSRPRYFVVANAHGSIDWWQPSRYGPCLHKTNLTPPGSDNQNTSAC